MVTVRPHVMIVNETGFDLDLRESWRHSRSSSDQMPVRSLVTVYLRHAGAHLTCLDV